jgi:hypothetical protein
MITISIILQSPLKAPYFYYGSTAILLGKGHRFTFSFLYTAGRAPWTGDQPTARHIYTENNTKQKKHTKAATPLVGFEPTTPVFEWAKTVHALDRTSY